MTVGRLMTCLTVVFVVFGAPRHGAGYAQTIPQLKATAEMRGYPGSGPVSVFNRPDGLGRAFDKAYGPGGAPADATITVTITVAANGDPVASFPREDIWLETVSDPPQLGLVACGGAAIADWNTNELGETVFANPLFAGGQSSGLTWVVLMGDPAADSALHLWFNSPDIDGDGTVNLTDGGAFAVVLFGAYDYAADFNFDGAVNISDVGFMADSFGAQCPE